MSRDPSSDPGDLTRRRFLAAVGAALPAAALPGAALSSDSADRFAGALADRATDPSLLTVEAIRAAEIVAGVTFTVARAWQEATPFHRMRPPIR